MPLKLMCRFGTLLCMIEKTKRISSKNETALASFWESVSRTVHSIKHGPRKSETTLNSCLGRCIAAIQPALRDSSTGCGFVGVIVRDLELGGFDSSVGSESGWFSGELHFWGFSWIKSFVIKAWMSDSDGPVQVCAHLSFRVNNLKLKLKLLFLAEALLSCTAENLVDSSVNLAPFIESTGKLALTNQYLLKIHTCQRRYEEASVCRTYSPPLQLPLLHKDGTTPNAAIGKNEKNPTAVQGRPIPLVEKI
ncbi:hypothetical protein L1049_021548 [Liquidambar formosana]|uniref:Uncharacterized protein n=1 Tax=Liquidambar formosana TaxID=63359 RepID=A0AAP0R5A5_LIQFO